jgi:hypothetical protein
MVLADGTPRGWQYAITCSRHSMLVRLPVRRFVTNAAMIAMIIGGVVGGQWTLPDSMSFAYAPGIGLFIVGSAFLFLCVGVRCERCSYKLFWHAVAEQKHPAGLRWFFQATTCPNCGYTRGR